MEITTEISDDLKSELPDISSIIKIYKYDYEKCVITEKNIYIFDTGYIVNTIERNDEIDEYMDQYAALATSCIDFGYRLESISYKKKAIYELIEKLTCIDTKTDYEHERLESLLRLAHIAAHQYELKSTMVKYSSMSSST